MKICKHKKILILGGTGVIGISLAKALSLQGYEITLTSRTPNRYNLAYDILPLASTDIEALKKLLTAEWDIIVDLLIHETNIFDKIYKTLLNSCKHYIFVSSSRVYSDDNSIIDENSPLWFDISSDQKLFLSRDYCIKKAEQEYLLRDSDSKKYSIVRPYITFGDGRYQLFNQEKEQWLSRVLSNRPVIFCDKFLELKTTITSSAHVANCLFSIIDNPPQGEIYNPISGNIYTWKEIIDAYSSVIMQVTGQKINIEYCSFNEYCIASRGLYQITYDRCFDRAFNAGKMNKLLAKSGFSGLEDSLDLMKNSLRRFLQLGLPLKYDAYLDGLADAVLGSLDVQYLKKNKPNLSRYAYGRLKGSFKNYVKQ